MTYIRNVVISRKGIGTYIPKIATSSKGEFNNITNAVAQVKGLLPTYHVAMPIKGGYIHLSNVTPAGGGGGGGGERAVTYIQVVLRQSESYYLHIYCCTCSGPVVYIQMLRQ